MYAKLLNEYEIEYPPKNKGQVINYNIDESLMQKDGYKLLILADKPNNDRYFEVKYVESENNIQEIVNYLETEEEYTTRKNNENIQSEIDSINVQINELDIKRIRAICEPSIKNEATGETWLEYYNAQIFELRSQIQALQERKI